MNAIFEFFVFLFLQLLINYYNLQHKKCLNFQSSYQFSRFSRKTRCTFLPSHFIFIFSLPLSFSFIPPLFVDSLLSSLNWPIVKFDLCARFSWVPSISNKPFSILINYFIPFSSRSRFLGILLVLIEVLVRLQQYRMTAYAAACRRVLRLGAGSVGTRPISELAKPNGKRVYLVDTLALVIYSISLFWFLGYCYLDLNFFFFLIDCWLQLMRDSCIFALSVVIVLVTIFLFSIIVALVTVLHLFAVSDFSCNFDFFCFHGFNFDFAFCAVMILDIIFHFLLWWFSCNFTLFCCDGFD